MQQLDDYDRRFAAFFDHLAAHGINKSNTLFVITVDEGDHFAGGNGTPDASGDLTYTHTACPGHVATACPANQIGEVNVKIGAVIPQAEPIRHPLRLTPDFYVNGDARIRTALRTDPAVRKLERDVWNATSARPVCRRHRPDCRVSRRPGRQKALHMINADPKRTPTFTMFGNPDFFFQTDQPVRRVRRVDGLCEPGLRLEPRRRPGRDRQHLGRSRRPRCAGGGIDSDTWTDHTNVRPTMLCLCSA